MTFNNLHLQFPLEYQIGYSYLFFFPFCSNKCYNYNLACRQGVVDGRSSSDAACHAGGPGSIPGPVQTYVSCGKVALFCNPASGLRGHVLKHCN
jgi:hypothetical protein